MKQFFAEYSFSEILVASMMVSWLATTMPRSRFWMRTGLTIAILLCGVWWWLAFTATNNYEGGFVVFFAICVTGSALMGTGLGLWKRFLIANRRITGKARLPEIALCLIGLALSVAFYRSLW